MALYEVWWLAVCLFEIVLFEVDTFLKASAVED